MSFADVGSQVETLATIEQEITRSRHPVARRNTSFYPSSASVKLEDGTVLGGCWRADWYRICGVQPSDQSEFYMHMIWHLGKSIELKLIDAMKCAGIYEADGVKFQDPVYNVSGELDIVGRYRLDDQVRYYGSEIKSVYGVGATKTISGRSRAWKGQEAFAPAPKTENLMQVMIYLDQFHHSKGEQYHLDFFKLIYIPRDKPSSGREYTVTLVSSDMMPDTVPLEIVEKLKPGHRYAYIQTIGYPPFIEERFSIEDIYDRFLEEKAYFTSGEAPPRPYDKFYSEEYIEALYEAGELGKTEYEAWVKAGRPKANIQKTPGHYLCQSYCDYRSFCYKRDGSPNPEADRVAFVSLESLR